MSTFRFSPYTWRRAHSWVARPGQVCAGLVMAASLASLAHAQTTTETRESIATQARQAKALTVRRHEPAVLERWLLKNSDELLLGRLFNPRHGFFARVGLPGEGAGFGAGPAWRISDLDRRYMFTASSAVSPSANWVGEAALVLTDLLPSKAPARLFATLSLVRTGRMADDFWGLGMANADVDRTAFKLTQSVAGGTIGSRLQPWLRAGIDAGYLTPTVRRGRQSGVRSTHDVFSPEQVPGLAHQPAFTRTGVFVDVDYRDTIPSTRTAVRLDQAPLAGASRGGRYQLSFADYQDLDLGQFSFRRVTVDLQQHVPFLDGHRVWSFRGLAVLSDTAPGQQVPFYLSPTLGGSTIGRAFPTFRFRDQNLIALQAEYRFVVNPFVGAAVFTDVGQVAGRFDELAWSRFRASYGVGLRAGARGTAAIRLDLAFAGSDPRLVLGLGHAF